MTCYPSGCPRSNARSTLLTTLSVRICPMASRQFDDRVDGPTATARNSRSWSIGSRPVSLLDAQTRDRPGDHQLLDLFGCLRRCRRSFLVVHGVTRSAPELGIHGLGVHSVTPNLSHFDGVLGPARDTPAEILEASWQPPPASGCRPRVEQQARPQLPARPIRARTAVASGRSSLSTTSATTAWSVSKYRWAR